MTEYLNLLFESIEKDKGKKINKCIEYGIINYKDSLDNLLREGTSSMLYLFAYYVKNITKEDKIIIANELIKRRDFPLIFEYAKAIEGAPIKLLEEAIIESKIAYYILLFAREIKEANIELLERAIIDIKSGEYILRFAKDIKGANIDLLEEAIIKTNCPEYICSFAMNIPNSHLELLEEALVNIGDLDEYKRFLEYKKKIQDEYFEKLVISINKSNDNDLVQNRERYMYLFKEPNPKAKALVRKLDNRGY